jgi:aminodeoxyfutalosine deaminase
MIVRAPVIVTMNHAPIVSGAVRINDDRIAQVGQLPQLTTSRNERDIIELDACVLLPGLINAHCHLDYTGLGGKIPPPFSFADWIRAINVEKAKLTEADYLRSINEGFQEARRFGTTSIVNLEAFPQLIAGAHETPLRTWWCAELIDVTDAERAEEIVSAALRSMGVQNEAGGFGLAPHALFTASSELYQRCQWIAATDDLLLTTHLAESREEMEMFRDAAGPLFRFVQPFGRGESDCGNQTPVQNFLGIIRDGKPGLADCVGCVAASNPKAFEAQNDKNEDIARWIVAHLNEVTEHDFELLAQLPEKFSVAHCPRSHAYFRHSPFAFERLHQLGFNICLATDSLATNTNLSLFAEMRQFRREHDDIPPEELLRMVTMNPAKALGRATGLGRIAPGYLADMIALPLSGSADVYEQIIAFNGDVPWMMIGGEIL